jgi:hypothetical protein
MAERRSKRWTPQEDDRFRRLAEANTRPEVIAAKLDRSVHAIKARAYVIGLPLKWFKLKAKWKILNPDTKSPGSTSDIVSAARPPRGNCQSLPRQRMTRISDRLRAVFVCGNCPPSA